MASFLGGLRPDVRESSGNESPAPLVSRSAGGLSGFYARRDGTTQLGVMATNGTIFGIVDKTSTAVGKTEWRLYRKAKSGKDEDRVEITRHAALSLINKPNPFMTRMELFQTGQQHLDLIGEGCFVVGRSSLASIPLELWPVRPDRMTPVAHPTKYLTGWIYAGPDGEQIPLRTDEVIHVRMPNPTDPYRGLSPVTAVLTDIMGAEYASQWNAAFFRDSAEPGGIIKVDDNLTDDEFTKLATRWEEQHRGVARAHRVGILEANMEWVPRAFSQRDMEFTSLRGVTRDAIMEGFGFPKPMLGITEDVNRANADAGEYVFAKWLTVPRDDRWKDALNTKLLPLFGADVPDKLEFDYDSPVPEDEAAENASLTARSTAAKTLIDAGFDGESVKEALDLPEALVWEKPPPPPVQMFHLPPGQPGAPDGPGEDDPTSDDPEADPQSEPKETAEPVPPTPPAPAKSDEDAVNNLLASLFRDQDAEVEQLLAGLYARPCTHHNADLPEAPDGVEQDATDTVDGISLDHVQTDWESALDALLTAWQGHVVTDWIQQLLTAARDAIDGDRSALAALQLDVGDAVDILADALASYAETAAGHVVEEADESGVDLEPAWPGTDFLRTFAEAVAGFEAARYALSAGREASRLAGPDADVDDVITQLSTFLDGLSDAGARTALGGALTGVQNQARADTFSGGPVGALYASEILDSATCEPCREIHGRWICNTDDLTALNKLYPHSGYVDCLGRDRCRGTVVGVWRPETTEGGQ
ncbi:phage portal protein [Amycolatopsis sp., V23-08]|uniref:Phage portal protein n=1 Tax=Amycolatopsis heterodermiae TaxID=3110235 RepID=A0ABU5RIG7_9PSEU|nr:phage portal protein [Amycolatopsis sp., V23-08]MEA5366091.1 phage portal protein [Amycolatopsis sp., V23-08]